ncbi:hypothetical protein WJX84_010699 [Apatococcus fuscideae]|uniref:Uncharacterized protein n=1 Tax=Apatococcus fuscideae TaxID=2026836 RepID=A0AAW1S1T3_9CHLO
MLVHSRVTNLGSRELEEPDLRQTAKPSSFRGRKRASSQDHSTSVLPGSIGHNQSPPHRKAAISPELVRSIQHGCSLVVGTGATLNMMDRHRTQADFSRAKDWTGLLAGSLNHAISMLHLDQKYPRLGNDATEAEAEAALKELTQVVGGVGMPPSEFRSICVGSILTQLQVDLDCPTAKGLQALAPLMKWVATLNFDDFLERVLWRTPRVHLPTGPVYPIVQHSQSRAFYYHLHGVAGGQASDAPAMLCHKDYAEALPAFKEVYFSHMRASS